MAIEIALFSTLLAASFSVLGYTIALGVPPVPARGREADALVALLEAEGLKGGARVVELGAGWGGVALRIARALPQVSVIGYELSPLPYLVAKVRCLGVTNCSVERANFFDADLRNADAATAFLMIKPMARLETKLSQELEEGTPVVAVGFQFRNRVAESTLCRGDVALYRFGASGSPITEPKSRVMI